MRWTMAILAGLLAMSAAAQETPALKTQKEKVSYALGMDLGKQLKKLAIDVEPAIFALGLKDAFAGSKTLLTEAEAQAAISELQAELKKKEFRARRLGVEDPAKLELMAKSNEKAGETFLAENKMKEGVVTLPSGLQYRVLKAGDGKKPALNDVVVFNTRGTLLDGTEFYNTYKLNQPLTRPVKEVIKGCAEALQLMPVGSKWQLFVPPDLAYGESGSGSVGPNVTLVFEMELISIQPPKPSR